MHKLPLHSIFGICLQRNIKMCFVSRKRKTIGAVKGTISDYIEKGNALEFSFLGYFHLQITDEFRMSELYRAFTQKIRSSRNNAY